MTYELTDDNKVVFDFDLTKELTAGTPVDRYTIGDMLYLWPYAAKEYDIIQEAYLVVSRETCIL